jgi:Uma2 family endonuclease
MNAVGVSSARALTGPRTSLVGRYGRGRNVGSAPLTVAATELGLTIVGTPCGTSIMITSQSIEPPALTEWVPSPLYQMTVDQYESLVESGAFTKRDRLHLINGLLVAKMTQGDPHCTADDLCRIELSAVLPLGWYVRPDKPVRIPLYNEPEPDQAVVRGTIRDYSDHPPGPEDVALIAEIASSSLAEDRKMASVYGNASIPVYWIVNLVDRQVEVFWNPRKNGYADHKVYLPGDTVPVVIDGQVVGQIAVDDLLP